MEEMKFNEFSVAWSFVTVENQKELHVFFVKGQFDFENQTPTDLAVFGNLGIKGYKKEVKSDFNESTFGGAELLRMYGEIYDFATGSTIDSPWSIIEPKFQDVIDSVKKEIPLKTIPVEEVGDEPGPKMVDFETGKEIKELETEINNMNNFTHKAERVAQVLKGIYPNTKRVTVYNDSSEQFRLRGEFPVGYINFEKPEPRKRIKYGDAAALEREIEHIEKYLENLRAMRDLEDYDESPIAYISFDID